MTILHTHTHTHTHTNTHTGHPVTEDGGNGTTGGGHGREEGGEAGWEEAGGEAEGGDLVVTYEDFLGVPIELAPLFAFLHLFFTLVFFTFVF